MHRDVKPGNVLLGVDGAVKLADFGIAKRLDDAAGDVTVVGDIIGTPKYLAPELVGGQPATPSSDVYAAGAVLFEMLAGRPPFDAETPLATALAHRDHPVPDVGALRPVPERLAGVVRTAMAKDPAHRFALGGRHEGGDDRRRAQDEVFAAPSGTTTFPRTEVMPQQEYRRSGRSPWWVAIAAALVVAGGVLAYLVVDGDDPESSAPSTTDVVAIAPATTLAPSTAATTSPPTTVATTAASRHIDDRRDHRHAVGEPGGLRSTRG